MNSRTMLLAAAAATTLLVTPAFAHTLPNGVTEIRVQGTAPEEGERELARFPKGSSNPTYKLILSTDGNFQSEGLLVQGTCVLFVRLAPNVLPLKTFHDEDGWVGNDELYITDGGMDGDLKVFGGPFDVVGQTGETIRLRDVAIQHDRGGCWAGATIQHAKLYRWLYR